MKSVHYANFLLRGWFDIPKSKAKYDYFLNGKSVKRKDFFNHLKNNSQKKVRSYNLMGYGVSVYDFDKKKYNSYCRMLHGSGNDLPKSLVFVSNGKTEWFSIQKK